MRPGSTLNTLFGVGCDGSHFIFVRFYNDKWQVQDPVEINKHSAERFLWALFNLGTRGKRFEPDYLAGDFGSAEGSVASAGIKVLYDAISTTTNPKAQTFFNQWKILFGEVCGYDVDNPSEKIKKLATFYGVPASGVNPAEMLFAVHTYYALFMKLLAGEIIGHFHKLPSLIGKMIAAPSAAKLKAELAELEAGGIFRHLGITNFLEGDLFAWYLPAWSDDIEQLVRKMTARLDQYNPGTLAEEPAESRDMLKKLYQQLFPKSVRHDLGEYYTPDWLAEHVLNELGYVGDPDKRILDPACGSGTFLVMAITRIRAWYEKNREKLRYDDGELCKKILANVVGFDLNPLAVMAARTNYLIAIRDLVTHVDKVEIPVYLCDSILTPSTYGGLFAGSTNAAKELKTSAARFLIPTEIATDREDVAKYAEQLEFCVRNGYAPDEFVQRCQDEGLSITAKPLHADLYKELVKLDKANKNGVWARIIKNAFAPLFVGKVDYVAGNPPWINIENLPSNYLADVDHLWDKYELRHSLSGPQIGSTKRDICALFVFACSDYFLDERGGLGFVLTQSLFKSKGAGDGFRRFTYVDKHKRIYLTPKIVHDLSDFNVFAGAVNRTAVLAIEKSTKPFEFPIPYSLWGPVHSVDLPEDGELEAIRSSVSIAKLDAIPSDPSRPSSPWLTVAAAALDALQKIQGKNAYRAYTGAYTGGLNGAYWLREHSKSGERTVYENMGDVGKKPVKVVQAALEPGLVHQLVRGRDLHRWHSEPSAFILLPYDFKNECWISEMSLKAKAPKTYEFLLNFKPQLLQRKTALVRQQMIRGPFYAMVAVAAYTFAPWKVIYKRLSDSMQAAVVPREHIPHEKVILIPATTEDEAHYIAALLNSGPANVLLRGAAVRVQTIEYAPSDVAKLAISTFNAKDSTHKKLAALSKKTHTAAASEDIARVRELESQIDAEAAIYWGLADSEVIALAAALHALETSGNAKRKKGKVSSKVEDDD
jgi:hypothetical protein